MSCKVLPSSGAPVAAWRIRADVEDPGGAAASESPQLAQRVQELEAALQTQVQMAYDKGLREGERLGRERRSAELRPVEERMLRTIDEIASMKDRLRREAEADLLKLAIAIARRILNRELSVDPEATAGLVQVALNKLRGQDVTRVRVHPAQEAALRAFAKGAPALAGAAIVADGQLQSGGAILETGRGNLDATVEAQLGEIERGLVDRVRRER